MNNTNTTCGHVLYHPEMGETAPADVQMTASLSHYGNHWYVKSPITLTGRGVSFINTLTAEQLTPQAQHRVGWHEYKLTDRAFKALCTAHKVATELLL